VCGSARLCRRRERRLIGARFGRWREERFGRARCLTLRYSVLISVWVDPSAEHRAPTVAGGRFGLWIGCACRVAVESRIGPKRGFGLTLGELLTLTPILNLRTPQRRNGSRNHISEIPSVDSTVSLELSDVAMWEATCARKLPSGFGWVHI